MKQPTVLAFEFVQAIPEKLEDGTLYVSMDYATVVHKCCCGCGREVVTPLSPTDWKLTFDLLDDAAELMAEHMGEFELEADPTPVADPAVPVATANAIRFNPDNGAMRRAFRVGEFAHHQGLAHPFHDRALMPCLLWLCPLRR